MPLMTTSQDNKLPHLNMHKRNASDVTVVALSQACPDCGCTCRRCFSNHTSLDLHQEIEGLESQLRKSNNHITQVEHELLDSQHVAENDVLKLRDELTKLRDRYDRLYESHKRLQKVNHGLEDKLLKVVNVFEGDKINIQKEAAVMTSKLVEAKCLICELEEENDKFRKDCNYAVQLLQCKPSSFVAHKLNTLPVDLQERVKCHMTREEIINCEDAPQNNNSTKLIRVPMQTFPPTAMVYSINNTSEKLSKDVDKNSPDSVPMNLIAQVLTQPESKRTPRRMYICVQCKRDVMVHDKEVQVTIGRETKCSTGGTGLQVHKPPGRVRMNSTETEI